MDSEILSHLIEIKEQLAKVEAKQDQMIGIDERVQTLEKEMRDVKTTFRIFQWGIGICVALIATLAKTWKS